MFPNLLKRLYSSESFILLGKWNKNRLEPAGPNLLVWFCISLSVFTSCWIYDVFESPTVLKTLAPGGGSSYWDFPVW